MACRLLPVTGLLFLIVFIAGCANFPVVIKEDSFFKSATVSVDMWHTVLDSDFDNIRALYCKEISGGRISDPVATIVFAATIGPYENNYHGEDLDREAYIMVDSELFPVQLADSTNERYKQDTVIYDYPFYGYFHFFYFSPGVMIVRERNNHILTAKIQLTPDIQKALDGAVSYKIRLYAGKNLVTLEATPGQLEALKKFLLYGRPTVSNPGI